MQINHAESNILVTSGGTMCLFDERGRLIGTVPHPAVRRPGGAGAETVYLERAAPAEARTG